MILLKVTKTKNVWFAIIGFLIMDAVCNGCRDVKR